MRRGGANLAGAVPEMRTAAERASVPSKPFLTLPYPAVTNFLTCERSQLEAPLVWYNYPSVIGCPAGAPFIPSENACQGITILGHREFATGTDWLARSPPSSCVVRLLCQATLCVSVSNAL